MDNMYAEKMNNFFQPPKETIFGPEPQHAYCQACGKTVMSKTNNENTAVTWLICCLTGFWCILCMDCTKDVVHRCSHCGTYLGKYKR